VLHGEISTQAVLKCGMMRRKGYTALHGMAEPPRNVLPATLLHTCALSVARNISIIVSRTAARSSALGRAQERTSQPGRRIAVNVVAACMCSSGERSLYVRARGWLVCTDGADVTGTTIAAQNR
jgi:hypothetical protein